MANFIPISRSNYFRVLNTVDFMAKVIDKLGLEVYPGMDGDDEVFMVFPEMGDWPTEYVDPEDEEEKEFEVDVVDIIRPHLPPGEVCILHTIGYEKLRYLNHAMVAFNSAGVILHHSQESFYDELNRLGYKFARAES